MTTRCVDCGGSGPFRGSRKKCRKCESAVAGNWAKLNRESKRAHNNAYHSRHSADRAAQTARWRAAHPEAAKAHAAVRTEIRSGRMKRQRCEVCGKKGNAHHDDYYAKPLEVRWLCHEHHMRHHAMLAESAAKPG